MSNSKVYCCVYGCKSRANKDLVSFHSFPKHGTCSVEINNKNGVIEKVDVRKVWEKNLKCGKTISSSMKVCSKHFEDSDFCLHVEDNRPKKSNLRRNRLKRNAIPTKNLPKGSHETGVNKERRRIKKYDAVQPILNTTCESMKDEQEAANEVHAQEYYERESSENMKITKKRKYTDANAVKVEVKEENTGGNDYLMAKGRLNSVLKQLTEQSDSDSSSDENSTRKRKRKENPPAPYHHTYVMKLFDRSVDLAQFEEDTPLYPICRAWMKNQPRNPQAVVKRRVSSPEPENHSWNGNTDINCLPPPSGEFHKRIPSPLPCQKQNKDAINLNYEEAPPVPQNVLIKDHLQRWAKVRKHWIETAAKNESRYTVSTEILRTLYNRSHEVMEA